MAPAVRKIYDQMPEPKWAIAVGACASSGGMMNSYSTVQGVDEIIPVDLYCFRLSAAAGGDSDAVMLLQRKIMAGEPSALDRWKKAQEKGGAPAVTLAPPGVTAREPRHLRFGKLPPAYTP